MTKAQIIEQMSEKVTTLTKRQAEVVVNTIFDCIRDSLKNGDKTEIRGFGSFRLRARRMKEGRNPKTGATVAEIASWLNCNGSDRFNRMPTAELSL